MNWPWRMPREWPWSTPYPLPRDTSSALLAEGHCENFGLLLERYLAFGSNRGQVQLVRELADRSALMPDFTNQKELIDAYLARWQNMAAEIGAITFSARPQWRVIVGLGTNDILEGGIVLHPVFGFPILPATSLKGVARATHNGCRNGPRKNWTLCWEWQARTNLGAETSFSSTHLLSLPQSWSAT